MLAVANLHGNLITILLLGVEVWRVMKSSIDLLLL